MTILLLACGAVSTPLQSTPEGFSSTSAIVSATQTSAPPPTHLANSPTATNAPAPTTLPNVDTFPDPSAYQWIPVISGMASPVDIQFPDDGSGRMFIIEQDGRIRIVENGQMLDPPFLDIISKVGSQGNEQGLLGLAFHPNFKQNPYFYVNYIDLNGNTVIARFTANGNIVDPSSEKDLLHIQQPFPNHNGGQTAFGPDGYLYLGLGDGGSEGDPSRNGQNTNVLLGKILRIDVDHGDPYAIPSDNPFAEGGGGKPEIWEYGLRNPWRFSFDLPSDSLYIGDVGQDTWEEVDVVPANAGGLNFGWSYYEGMHPYAGHPPATGNFTFPVTEYSHAVGGCAIIGGHVYRGTLPEWQGIYFYGDECSGFIWGLIHTNNGWRSQLLFRTEANITTFGEDPSGEIYFADRRGTIYRLSK
ncbi:MAG TPA: PQQ-dependent sugar dehydrogenase [Anaerolineales bacterium]|nr:PQQ-dependent sugar dehydrogenase [Anaerolineales bacterium]